MVRSFQRIGPYLGHPRVSPPQISHAISNVADAVGIDHVFHPFTPELGIQPGFSGLLLCGRRIRFRGVRYLNPARLEAE